MVVRLLYKTQQTIKDPCGSGIIYKKQEFYEVKFNSATGQSETKTIEDNSFTPSIDAGHGYNYLELRVRDLAGNWSNKMIGEVFVDLQQPPLPNILVSNAGTRRVDGTYLVNASYTARPKWLWNMPSEINNTGIKQYGIIQQRRPVIRPTGTRSDKWDIDYDEVYQTGTTFTHQHLLKIVQVNQIQMSSTISYGTRDCYHILKVRAQDKAGNWGDYAECKIFADFNGPSSDTPQPVSSVTDDLRPVFSWDASGATRWKIVFYKADFPNAPIESITIGSTEYQFPRWYS